MKLAGPVESSSLKAAGQAGGQSGAAGGRAMACTLSLSRKGPAQSNLIGLRPRCSYTASFPNRDFSGASLFSD